MENEVLVAGGCLCGRDEHNTLHLLYSRFIYLFDELGAVPKRSRSLIKRLSHGVILAPDGKRMSKARGM